MRASRFLVALVCLLLLATPAHAQVSIRGQVRNGTRDGPSVAPGTSVTFVGLRNNSIVSTSDLATDASGGFTVPAFKPEADMTYVASVEYLGVPYYSNLLIGDELTAESAFTVTVFETTPLSSTITLDPAHVIIEVSERALRVQELFFVQNAGDRTYVGQADPRLNSQVTTLHFSLPLDATELSIGGGDDLTQIIRTGDGFFDTSPIPPGSHEYQFSYALSYTGATHTVSKTFFYPTAQFIVLVTDVGTSVTSPQLTSQGTRSMGATDYLLLSAREPLSPGSQVQINLANLPQTLAVQGTAPADAYLRWLALGAGVLALLASLGFAFSRSRGFEATR